MSALDHLGQQFVPKTLKAQEYPTKNRWTVKGGLPDTAAATKSLSRSAGINSVLLARRTGTTPSDN